MSLNVLRLFRLLVTLDFLSSVTSSNIPCSEISNIEVPGADIVSISGKEVVNYTVVPVPTLLNTPITDLNFCNITVVITHPGDNDTVTNSIWLPPAPGWNGRFQAAGGGGYSVSNGEPGLGIAVSKGYSVGASDGGNFGLGYNIFPTSLKSNGEVDWPLFQNYAFRSIHDMAVIGKAATELYYGTAPKYSYMNGCSNGGRQGFIAAQKYPKDFDGVMAASPAVNFAQALVSIQWPYTVMKQENTAPSECMFNTFVNASIAECDGLDGVLDGIIGNIQDCNFNPYTLVGTETVCDGKTTTIDEATAKVIKMIHDGITSPSGEKIWSGQNWGTGFIGDFPGNIVVSTVDSVTVPVMPNLSPDWIKYMLVKDPNFDSSTLTYADMTDLFYQTIAEYDTVVGGSDPDISAFRDAGGKLLSWHGLGDNLLYSNGTSSYRQEVDEILGGTEAVNNFFRLFYAPGVNHCGGGYGPVPTDPLAALVAWVENGTAPESIGAKFIDSSGDMVTHDICHYPLVSRYNGGNTKVASSYSCATSFRTET